MVVFVLQAPREIVLYFVFNRAFLLYQCMQVVRNVYITQRKRMAELR